MTKCLTNIKNFLVGMFVQDERIGLKSLEKMQIVQEITPVKSNSDFKFSDIMK